MEDTSRQDRELVRKIIMAKTLEDRFSMCAEMYEEAKEFAKVGMPDYLSLDEREIYIFERIHGANPLELI